MERDVSERIGVRAGILEADVLELDVVLVIAPLFDGQRAHVALGGVFADLTQIADSGKSVIEQIREVAQLCKGAEDDGDAADDFDELFGCQCAVKGSDGDENIDNARDNAL